MIRGLLTADLHLTDKARDAYRFGLFDWLAKQQAKLRPTATYILGDLTDSKDRHSSVLVNKLVDGLNVLQRPIFILKGNHDYIDPDNPFFGFLSHIEGLIFVNKVMEAQDGVWMIPHCGTQAELDAACKQVPKNPDVIMLHGAFEGAIAETGARLSGFSLSPVENREPGAIWAGDIHRPQRVGRLLTYVGSPYHVRFGDDFNPRVLFVDGSKTTNLHFAAPRKWSLSINDPADLETMGLRPGDQVKIEIQLRAEAAMDAAKVKRTVLAECKRIGVEVFGCVLKLPPRKAITRQATKISTPADVLKEFCRNEGVPAEYTDAGFAMIE